MQYTHPLSGQNCRKDDAEPFLRRRWACCKKGNKRIAQCVEHFALRTMISVFQERHEGRCFIVTGTRPPGNNYPFSGSMLESGACVGLQRRTLSEAQGMTPTAPKTMLVWDTRYVVNLP